MGQRQFLSLLPISALFLLGATSVGTIAAPTFTFQGLGDLPGGNFYSVANGISADGSTVVGWTSVGESSGEAFRWTAETGMIGLGDLPGGYLSSSANSVNADGSVIVGRASSDLGDEAFRWTFQTGMESLNVPPLGHFVDKPEAVSSDGSVVVGWSVLNLGDDSIAYVWTPATGKAIIAYDALAKSVSADGCLVGGRLCKGSASDRAFMWSEDTGIIDLGPLAGDINGMSDDGLVLVGYRQEEENRLLRDVAIKWTDSEGFVDLFNGGAHDASADGSVIVGYLGQGGGAAVWDMLNGVRSIKQVLIDGGIDMTGWDLDSALSVSANGASMVGWGTNPEGAWEGWIATIPEPSTLSLLGFAAILGLRRR